MIRDVHHGLLSLGDAVSARDLKRIYDGGFAAVVDLAVNEPPAVLGRELIYCRFPLSDDGANDEAVLAAAILCVESLLARDVRTLVACSAGMSRSPVLAAAAVALRTGEPLAECLTRIAARAPVDVSPAFYASAERALAGLAESRR